MTPPPAITPLPPGPDTQHLLDASRPRQGMRGLRPSWVIGFLIAAMVIQLLPFNQPAKGFFQAMLWLAFVGAVFHMWSIIRAYRRETTELDQVEDLLVLKRVNDVILRLAYLMSSPMRADQNRLRAMVLLATALARLQRLDEALLVYNSLIDDERLAGPGGVMIKLGRVMTMLQSDHLYDADRAINDLRRLIDRGGAESEMAALDAEMPPGTTDHVAIAGLRLIEIYRDVKTGHAEEAISLFEENLEVLRRGLSHRLGEAFALAAVAYDRLGRHEQARERFSDATAIAPVVDLLNRYPEVRTLPLRYPPTEAPQPF